MRKNTFMFQVFDLKTGQKIEPKICFYGIDSEEAWVNCIEWAEHHYGKECHAEIIDGVIAKNEGLREEENLFIEAEVDAMKLKAKKVNIMSFRKVVQ